MSRFHLRCLARARGLAGRAGEASRVDRGIIVFFRVFSCAAAVTVAAGALALTGSAAQASGVQLTGTQLASALLPTAHFGAGYQLVPGSAASSGSRLEHPAVKVNMRTYSCKKWLMGDLPNTGYGETAYAFDSAEKFLG